VNTHLRPDALCFQSASVLLSTWGAFSISASFSHHLCSRWFTRYAFPARKQLCYLLSSVSPLRPNHVPSQANGVTTSTLTRLIGQPFIGRLRTNWCITKWPDRCAPNVEATTKVLYPAAKTSTAC